MQSFKNSAGKSVVEAMIAAIQENKAYLSEIDGLIGDGDHGANMNKGFTICQKNIAAQDIGFTEALDALGQVLFNEIGGSMGPIYGTIFMAMAEAGEEAARIDAALFYEMLRRAVQDLEEIVPARVGDKTLMDTLEPAVAAFEKVMKEGCDFGASLDAMTQAAAHGKESTRDLIARFGRSSRLGERSRGVLDAGAVSCNILLQAMASGIRPLLEDA